MSRIGKKPIAVPSGVEVKIDGSHITVKGPKGTLEKDIRPEMTVAMENGQIVVTRPNDESEMKALHGLTRTLVHNMVVGVSEGFSKKLEVNGVGYRAAKQGNTLVLTLGYSHPVNVAEVPGIHIDVPQPTRSSFPVPTNSRSDSSRLKSVKNVLRNPTRAKASSMITRPSSARKQDRKKK